MTDRPTVLVPIRVLEGESIPEGVPELLANAHVVLLGYHVIPEQTAPGQARMQFEERAENRLDEHQELFEDAGATVERRLVFTHQGQKTIDRMTVEHDCHAVLVPYATSAVDDVLVGVRGTVGVDRIAKVVAGIFGPLDTTVTLYHVAGETETDEDAQTLLDGLTGTLEDLGMDRANLHTKVERDQDPLDALVEEATDYDAVVMGESDPSLTTFVFGMPADKLADRFLGPVFVVEREKPPEAGKDEEDEGDEEDD